MKPAQFVREVRQEAQKVTWSTPKEVATSTMVVLVMVAIAACFFLLVDAAVYNAVQWILGI